MPRDPWRFRCPFGHSGLKNLGSVDHYECIPCQAYYWGTPFDARAVDEFPISDEEYTIVRTYGTSTLEADQGAD